LDFYQFFRYFIVVAVILRQVLGRGKEVLKTYLDISDIFILAANLIMLIVGFGSGHNVFEYETRSEALVKCLKGLRVFRLMVLRDLLSPLSVLAKAFFETFRRLVFLITLIAILGITMCCIGMSVFSYRARFSDEEGIEIAEDPSHGESPTLNFDTF